MSTKPPQQPAAATDEIGLHVGETLFRLSNTYPTVILTMVEAAQNAIDAGAEQFFICINLQRRYIVVLDDGLGVTVDKFREALRSVGKGVKRSGSLGRFGLGLISPLNKCREFVFASKPLRDPDEADDDLWNEGWEGATVWTFEGEKIKSQEKARIARRRAARLPEIPRQCQLEADRLHADWHTLVWLKGVTTDKVVGAADMDELQGQLLTKLGRAMHRKGTTGRIVLIDETGTVTDTRDINPSDYAGVPLPIVTYQDNICGTIRIELFRAPISGGVRRGEVVVMQMNDNYPVRWHEFRTQALGSRWLQDVKSVFDALSSGYFEGIIYAEKIELAPERTKFIMNEALRSLYLALYLWYEEVGKGYYDDAQVAHRERRYQELRERSLDRILALLAENAVFAPMSRRLHNVLPDEPPVRQPRPQRDDPDGDDSEPRRKRVVARPSSERKPRAPQVPKSNNMIFRFAYEVLDFSTRLWEFDLATGILTFNIRHPVWVKMDETNGKHTARNDKMIMHLQEWLALKLLRLLVHHDESDFDLELIRHDVDEEVIFYSEMFILAANSAR
jgi:hypothetical protein